MVKIIQGFRRPSPIAEGVRNAAESIFGDRLTPALKQAQLDRAQQEMALAEREANASRAAAESMDPRFGNFFLSGASAKDAGGYNLLDTATRVGNEVEASGGDLLGNIDLNAAQAGTGMNVANAGLGMREGHASDFRRTKYSADASAAASRYGADTRAATAAEIAEAERAAAQERWENELVDVVDQNGNARKVPRKNVNFMHSPVISTDERVSGALSPRLRENEIPDLSFEERKLIGAAPTLSERRGELLRQNFENLGGLGPRQAESLGALPTPPSETQVRGRFLERALDATGFDPSTVPEDVLMSAAGFDSPEASVFATADGQRFWSTDNGLHDMHTGERMPPSVEIGPVNATSIEDAGLSPTTSTATAAFDQAASLRSLGDLTDALRTTVENNPQVIGLEGSVRSAAMGAQNVIDSIDSLLGGEGALEGATSRARRDALDPAVATSGAQAKLAELGMFDPAVDAVVQLYNLILFKGAAALAGQEGRSLTEKDIQRIQGTIPHPRKWDTDPERYLGALNTVENIVGLEQAANQERMQGDFNAEAPAAAGAPEGLPPEVSEVWQFMTPEERALWQN